MKKTILIACATLFTFVAGAQAQSCADFFFSEYVEGTSLNKALEIYNPTNASKSLSGYTIRRYANGEATAGTFLDLTGTVAAYDVWVVTNGQIIPNSYGQIDSVLWLMADQHGTGDHATCPMYFNGNDALTLEKTGGVIVDIFAHIGPPDPGSGWFDLPGTNGDYITGDYWEAWTAGHPLIRKQTVDKGVVSNPSPFMVHIEWDSLPEDTWDHLGWHTCNCQPAAINAYRSDKRTYFFPNPVVNDELTVKGTDFISSVEIFNVLGESVLFRMNEAERGDMYIRLDELYGGVYFVSTTFFDGAIVAGKIIVR